MGYAVEGEEIPWARVYAGIEAGMHDAAVGVVPTPARREEAYYSHPLVSEYSILIKRPDASIEVDSLQDLEGLIVGTQIGFAYPRLESLEGVTMEGVDTDIINGRKLSAGRIDLAVVGSLTGRYTLDQAGIDYEVVGAIEALPLSVALAHDRFTPAQVERLNSTLSDILISERFSAIIRRYGVHDLVQTFSILPDEAPPDQSSMLGP